MVEQAGVAYKKSTAILKELTTNHTAKATGALQKHKQQLDTYLKQGSQLPGYTSVYATASGVSMATTMNYRAISKRLALPENGVNLQSVKKPFRGQLLIP